MTHRLKTKIPVIKPMTENNDEDVLSLSNTTSTSVNVNNDHIPYFPRGQNWRNMFDEEIACDITIDVDGALIKAHKNVLTSRCQYFAAMFSGKSKDSINTIYLDGFSFECVYFAICQIYSGNAEVLQNIDIFELADLADLLNLEGLKELVTYILELEYFHSFHKPCKECIFLISKFLPWSGAIGYAEIYYKILMWIEQYCDEIWCKKEFALLPYDIIKKCFLHHTLNIDTENVLEMVKRCEKLMYVLPKVSWTANIFRFSLQLLRECVHYISAHLADVLASESFMILGNQENLRLEDRMTAAIERANPLQVCAAYAQLHKLLRAPSNEFAPKWRDLLTRLAIHCEDALVCCASQAMSTSAWVSLQPDLQAKIRSTSGILPSSNYSQNVNKYNRERNVERIKYILYSQLGNINRVPISASRQHLPAPTASKHFFVAPGNSMVSSTKTNLRSSQTIIPACHNVQYKDVKPRYLNPKPLKNSQCEDPARKQAPSQNSKKLSKPVNFTATQGNKKIVKKPSNEANNNSKETNNASTTRQASSQSNSNSSNNYSTSYKFNESKKTKCPNSLTDNQTKQYLKNPPIFYVSPYSFKPSENVKQQKNFAQNSTGKFNFNNRSMDKTSKEMFKSFTSADKNKPLNDSISVDKRNISVSDTALSVDSRKGFRGSSQNIFNKSPTFKKSNFEYSSSFSSPNSHSSNKGNSGVSNSQKSKRDIVSQNAVKSISPKDTMKQKNTVLRGKSTHTFAKSTVSSSAKAANKPIHESNKNSHTFPSNIKKKNPCDIVNIPPSNILEDQTSNEEDNNGVCMFMTRSRTFLQTEPSIIGKEIILDSSIEMYP